jgi:hypothetical protein
MERKNNIEMFKKYAIYAVIAIVSFFLIRSLYLLFLIEDMLSKQKSSDIFSGLVILAVQPKITDIKMNILIEVIMIGICILVLNWNKIKK